MDKHQVSQAIKTAELEGDRKAWGDAKRMKRCLESWDGIDELVPLAGSRAKQRRAIPAGEIRAEAEKIARRYI